MKKSKKILVLVVILAIISSLTAGYVTLAGAGTSDDPLVSLSYLTSVFKPEIMNEVDQRVDSKVSEAMASQGTAQAPAQTGGAAYTAIQVLAGQTLLGSEGTELILRSGEAISVCPGSNGLVDATGGLDLLGNLTVEKNHVYIIPRDDGRGITMTTDGYVMVKGGYRIVE